MNLLSRFKWPVIILLAAAGIQLWSKTHQELIPWRQDYAAAVAEGKQTGKPLFLYFTATWCGPCQSLKTTTWADPAVAAELANYVPVKLDIDYKANADMAQKYNADGIPLFVLLDRRGNPARISVGALPPEDFLAWIKGELPLN